MIIRNDNIETLIEKSCGKKIVCYGAGYYFEQTCRTFESFDFFNKIDYILDNNPEKQGSDYEFGGEKRPIISPEKCFSEYPGEQIVIILMIYNFSEVLVRLQADSRLNNADCYLFTLLRGLPLKYDFPTHEGKKMIIPKKIHYCWFGGNPMPEEFKGYMVSWEKFCPDYEIIRWDESNYDITKNNYISQAYERKKWGFVSDYARLDIIYNHGGIYFDTDVELLRSMDNLLYDEAFCCVDLPELVSTGLGFGAIPKFEIVKEWRDMYDGISCINPDGSSNQNACSYYQSKVLRKYGFKFAFKPQLINGLRIYPSDVLSPKSTENWSLNLTPNTYSIHHFASTWVDCELLRIKKLFTEQVKEFVKAAKDF